MQAVMRATLGISELQYLNASPMQADRCSGVPWAKPAEDDPSRMAATAPPTMALRSVVMVVSFGPVASRRQPVDQVVRSFVLRTRRGDCDGGHRGRRLGARVRAPLRRRRCAFVSAHSSGPMLPPISQKRG